MGHSLSEYLTAQFYAWERYGRGWKVFAEPVHLEPEFVPFFGHLRPRDLVDEVVDSGVRPRFFPGIQQALGIIEKKNLWDEQEAFEKLEKLYPLDALQYENDIPITEMQVHFDKDTRVLFDYTEQLLLNLSSNKAIVGFEILGNGEKVTVQFVCTDYHTTSFKTDLTSYIPDVAVRETTTGLLSHLTFENPVWVIDMGLEDEFMLPLRIWTKFDPDPLGGCISALESLEIGEFGMIQVLFQQTVNNWNESVYRAILDDRGGSFFGDSPEMIKLAQEKTASPLFSVVIRTIGQADTLDRSHQIASKISHGLHSLKRIGSNELISLGLPLSCDVEDILQRRSRRIGMLLNTKELAGLVHIPDRTVISPKLRAYIGKTKRAPSEVIGNSFELGANIHLDQEVMTSLNDQHRLRHMHVIGATGSGKSTLLLKLLIQDIEQGRGCCLLDPHGDLIEEVIRHIPESRIKDVVLVDPSDTEYPIGLNLLSANTDAEKIILSSDLVALFRRFATSWGDQMTSVLTNAITAIVESTRGGTFIDLRRFLAEPYFRNKYLETISDPSIRYYWKHEFKLLKQNSIAPILTRLDTFLRPRILRNMMAQKEGLDFREVLDTGKILLVKLSQGLIGEENSYLLGTLFVSKLQQAAQTRQNLSKKERNPYYFYIDEFQNFITPSMSAILSGARKYGLGLILAHQDLDQLSNRDKELANSVLSNPAIRICFRCGDKDAKTLESSFSYFDASDLQSLKVGTAIARVSQKNNDFNVSFPMNPDVDMEIAKDRERRIVEVTRENYGTYYKKIEDLLHESFHIHRVPLKEDDAASEAPIQQEPVKEIHKETLKKTEAQIENEAHSYLLQETERHNQREHRAIQEYIKKVAEERNFKATLEEPVLDYTGKVDVSLLRDELKIACEVSVNNRVEYEVQNLQKCIAAGYALIFMICEDIQHLESIRSLAIQNIDSSCHEKLRFVSKERFIEKMDGFLLNITPPDEKRTLGYRIKLDYGDVQKGGDTSNTLRDIMVSAIKRKKENQPDQNS